MMNATLLAAFLAAMPAQVDCRPQEQMVEMLAQENAEKLLFYGMLPDRNWVQVWGMRENNGYIMLHGFGRKATDTFCVVGHGARIPDTDWITPEKMLEILRAEKL